jgi:NADH-quinone oxidoreductase subunit D
VLRLLCTLEGEHVRNVQPIIGYVHTGIEKSCEDQQYWKAITFVERMDYLAYYFNAMAFCMAVEKLLDIEVPPRAQYLRVAHMELNRIASHLFAFATGALDIGAVTMLWWGCRDRDLVLDLFEMSSGQRIHTRYFQVGGVIEDIPPGWEQKTREFLKIMPRRLDQYLDLLDRNEIWLRRTKGTGVISKERALELGVTGPLLRATGHPWDLRKAMPYSSYDDFDFKIPVGTVGDNYDRYRVRMAEMRESVKVIRQLAWQMPGGDFKNMDPKLMPPPRTELNRSMEAVIHHFKIMTQGYKVPAGEAYVAVESPRGELGVYIVSDGGTSPFRCHVRDPSFVNLQSLGPMTIGGLVADLIASIASVDPIMGGVDR